MRIQVVGWAVFEGQTLMGPLYLDGAGNPLYYDFESGNFKQVNKSTQKAMPELYAMK